MTPDTSEPAVGLAWRPELAHFIRQLPEARFSEVIAESLPGDGSPLPPGLAELIRSGATVVPHGVRLSLGGVEDLEPARLRQLAHCARVLGAPMVSEHIAFVRAGGRDAGHLLPLPRTAQALDVLVEHVQIAQGQLPVPLVLEPIATLFDWPEDEFSEADFLTELLDRTGAGLLVDVANVYANAVNRGRDPHADLVRLPLDRIAYIHVAGGAVREGMYHDTHTDPVPRPVLELLAHLREIAAPCPVLLERDGDYPPAHVLLAELDAVTAAARPAPVSRP